jgi:hypothetical protein
VGVYLATYTTVEMVNQSFSIGGYSVAIPQPQKVQPYLLIGIGVIVGGLISVGAAAYEVYGNSSPYKNN